MYSEKSTQKDSNQNTVKTVGYNWQSILTHWPLSEFVG